MSKNWICVGESRLFRHRRLAILLYLHLHLVLWKRTKMAGSRKEDLLLLFLILCLLCCSLTFRIIKSTASTTM